MDILGLGIGSTQLLVVLIVAFFVLGPERLPEVARQIARGIRTLRGYATDVQTQFGGEIDDLREEFSTIQRDLTSIQGNLRSGLMEIDSSIRSVHGDVQSAVVDATAPASAAQPLPESQEPARPGLDYTPTAPAPLRIVPPAPATDGWANGGGMTSTGPSDGRLPDFRPPK